MAKTRWKASTEQHYLALCWVRLSTSLYRDKNQEIKIYWANLGSECGKKKTKIDFYDITKGSEQIQLVKYGILEPLCFKKKNNSILLSSSILIYVFIILLF